MSTHATAHVVLRGGEPTPMNAGCCAFPAAYSIIASPTNAVPDRSSVVAFIDGAWR
jgi:hypothetical protein